MRTYNSLEGQKQSFNPTEAEPAQAMVVRPNGVVTYHSISADFDATFESFRAWMGLEEDSLLELVDAANLSRVADVAIYCFVDEEGIPKELEPNIPASALVGQNIYGPALFINAEVYTQFEDDLVDNEYTEEVEAE